MPLKYEVLFKGGLLALAFVSPHPVNPSHIVASVIPIERSGKWEDNTLEVHFLNPVSDLFPSSTPEVEAVKDLLTSAGIEPRKCQVSRKDPRG
jgi:hypothetical protein